MFTNIIQNFLNYLIDFALILRNITFVICSIASSPNKINVKLEKKKKKKKKIFADDWIRTVDLWYWK